MKTTITFKCRTTILHMRPSAIYLWAPLLSNSKEAMMTEIHKPSNEEELTEEEFIELVLAEQQKALAEDREQRLHGKKPKKQKPIVKWIVWSMALVLFFNTFALLFQIYSIPAIEFLKVSTRLSAQEDIQLYKQAVVEVSTGSSKGTGFAISEDGLVVTNEHVVDHAQTLSVVFPDKGIYEAELIESYPDVDLALLQVQGDDFPALELAQNPSFTKDEQVHFIGNPLAFTGIANEGMILEPILLEDWTEPVIMMQAPVYKGNSGSPVINEDGQVIGVIFATMKQEPYGRVGLFVPIQVLHNLRQ